MIQSHPAAQYRRHPGHRAMQVAGALPQLQTVGYYPQLQVVGESAAMMAQLPQQYPPQPQYTPLQGGVPGARSVGIIQGQPSEVRQWLLPMLAVSLAQGEADVTANTAQLIVKPVRLTIIETVGPTVLTGMAIGQRSQFIATTGVVPVAAFSQTATDTLLSLDSASVGNDVSLSLSNEGTATSKIFSCFFCVTAAY